MTHRILFVIVALLGASFIERAHPAEMITLRYGQNAAGANSLSSLPLIVAERKGFFVREGIYLVLITLLSVLSICNI